MSDKVTWYGHATLGLETGGHKVLIDPFFEGNPACGVTAEDAQADYILVTHGHGDHIGDAISIARRTGARIITNFEIANWLDARGVQTHAQHLGGGYRHPFGYVKMTPALHGSALPDGSYGGSPGGFLVTTAHNHRIYFAGDTGLFSDMQLIGEEGVDLAVLPIGDNYTMGPDDALRAVKLLQPKRVIPIHFSTWELIAQDVGAWARRVEAETSTLAVVLEPSGVFTLPD